MKEPKSDRWIAVTLSVLLHGGVVALLVYGWWSFRERSTPLHTLALDATVVDSKALSGSASRPAPAPAPTPPPSPTPPPPPAAPDSDAQRAAAQQAEAEKRAAEEKHLAEEKRVAEERRQAEEKAAQQQREEVEKKAQEEAERKAEEAKRKEQQRLAEAKRLAEEKRKAEEARQQAEEEADLKKSLAEEEHLMAARSGGAMASWLQQITARITRAWNKPPTARPGIDCMLYVTQVPGGEVVNVRLGACNGDQAVRESIEAAAYRASPLPPPPDPALFDRNLAIHFNPSD